ncbi:MAG: hypothetical protein KGJ02_01245 [Verrucomicrobiota bacterium]|nr:hypothetical protein [Verrucomicrobiota bacterium]
MRKLLFFLLSSSFLCATGMDLFKSTAHPNGAFSPWLTGPLIAPFGAVVPYGNFEVESYIFCPTDIGTYNSNWNSVPYNNNYFSFNPQFFFYFGLTSWFDLNVVPQFFYNTSGGQNGGGVGDLPIALDFQLLDPNATPYFPGIKFIVRETFPTGAFQNLSSSKLLTDQTGYGTFGSAFGLVLYKVYYLIGHCCLSTTYTGIYTINSPVHVHNYNAYGGGSGTNGRVLPGNSFQGIISFELALSQNWVLALDNVYTHTDQTQFYGTLGTTSTGATASVGFPSSEQISFAPAIEYNFSSHFGIIAGCWLTAWGRNSTQFISGAINFDYTY